ncbi:hypothetical protein SLNWT_4728 [Streptomyces albus]|uniref:Uncharacterized protein n=1 Tax=Streptomyces albus (strain ATCC 21838 / DSM 41398 / FERM P-419 / JCM 4703 / NBRC 107858) TaxID=1081613 RepID=A0A0B5ETT1_STRA4|nr:hypothetical protein SLNWT_4728 [Streptomyces albus]AOU79411.1 hypothetical protein SLNHY_4720 [Streptomyces albus]
MTLINPVDPVGPVDPVDPVDPVSRTSRTSRMQDRTGDHEVTTAAEDARGTDG